MALLYYIPKAKHVLSGMSRRMFETFLKNINLNAVCGLDVYLVLSSALVPLRAHEKGDKGY